MESGLGYEGRWLRVAVEVYSVVCLGMGRADMAVRRLPRVDLAKLTSADPAERRPSVDTLGESLCRHGAVRVLVEGGDLPSSEGLGSLVLAGMELYFGLVRGRLVDLVTPDSNPDGVDPRAWVVRIGTGLSGEGVGENQAYEVEAGEAQGLSVSWTPRAGEVLALAGPRFAAWTRGVVAVGSVTTSATQVAGEVSSSIASGSPEWDATLWNPMGSDEALEEFLPA